MEGVTLTLPTNASIPSFLETTDLLSHPSWRLTWLVLDTVYSTVVLALNAFVVRAIYVTGLLHKDNRFVFLSSLALSDLIVGVFWWPKALTFYLPAGRPTDALCLASTLITDHCILTTVYTILALAVEQYVNIIYPFHYAVLVTKRRALMAAVLPWILGLGKDVFLFIGSDMGQTRRERCSFVEFLSEEYLWFVLISHVLVPFAMVTLLHVRVLVVARSHVRRIHDQRMLLGRQRPSRSKSKTRRERILAGSTAVVAADSDVEEGGGGGGGGGVAVITVPVNTRDGLSACTAQESTTDRARRAALAASASTTTAPPTLETAPVTSSPKRATAVGRWKAVQTTFAIIALHAICWLPFSVTIAVYLSRSETRHTLTMMWFGKVSLVLFSSNSWINPIVYAMQVSEIRGEFFKLLAKFRTGTDGGRSS